MFRLDRKARIGGGVCIYVRSDFVDCKVVDFAPVSDVEILWLCCTIQKCLYYIACCYHPPKPKYHPTVLANKLAADLQCIINSRISAFIVVAGDFNSLDTGFLETDFGLTQIVTEATHCNNILDKVFVNRPDIYSTDVFCSLLKTKHKAVLVHPTCEAVRTSVSRSTRKKVVLYDLQQHNIDRLRYYIGTYDWKSITTCNSVNTMYSSFLHIVRTFIHISIPTKTITLGPRDPDYVTPLVKSLLNKRRKLRRQGKCREADELARKINGLISDYRNNRLAHLSEAGPKELWAAVKDHGRRTINNSPLLDPDTVNTYFAAIATDDSYCIDEVLKYCVPVDEVFYPLTEYQIEPLLRRIQRTSSGFDDLPYWVFKKCSYELAEIVTNIFNRSFTDGLVPSQWHTAVVTPVPKKTLPTNLSDYRPISVTPIMSRLAEKILVQQWLRIALPIDLINDQFAFRPTGSTTSALVKFTHHASLMLEENSYVRCLLVDFSKAFDVVRHSVLLSKISRLNIPSYIRNWIVSFLTGRSQVCRTPGGGFSAPWPITSSIVQGSGVGPTLWIIMESDLQPLSRINILFKYADDTNLLVPENTDISLSDEFTHIKQWAELNGLIINVEKTKELVLHRPHPSKYSLPQSLEGIERVYTVKLLGVIFQSSFSFVNHVDAILKVCSQRIFLLKQLRDQGMPLEQLHTVFQAIILSRLTYAIPVWGPYLSAELKLRIDAFLKRSYRCGFSKQIYEIQTFIDSTMHDLFTKIQAPNHCLFHLLPPRRPLHQILRGIGHGYELPTYNYKLHKQSFVTNSLFKYNK